VSLVEAVLGVEIDSMPITAALPHIDGAIQANKQCVAYFANVHVIETARADHGLRAALRRAEFVFPDGAPIAWIVSLLTHRRCRRVAGADCFDAVNSLAADRGYRVFLLGSTADTVEALAARLRIVHPGIRIVGKLSPPFLPLASLEWADVLREVNAASPDVLWVALGAPKQELWVAQNRHALNARFIATVGAVFEFGAGTRRRAPRPIQRLGLEWAFRLAHEPRRLAGRYAKTNTSFVVNVVRGTVRAATGARRATTGA
jgi:N-acetylglucosaminyldiphosphoundecaprenol N-acetyl-beta-D-mannosaminyltransferase